MCLSLMEKTKGQVLQAKGSFERAPPLLTFAKVTFRKKSLQRGCSFFSPENSVVLVRASTWWKGWLWGRGNREKTGSKRMLEVSLALWHN